MSTLGELQTSLNDRQVATDGILSKYSNLYDRVNLVDTASPTANAQLESFAGERVVLHNDSNDLKIGSKKVIDTVVNQLPVTDKAIGEQLATTTILNQNSQLITIDTSIQHGISNKLRLAILTIPESGPDSVMSNPAFPLPTVELSQQQQTYQQYTLGNITAANPTYQPEAFSKGINPKKLLEPENPEITNITKKVVQTYNTYNTASLMHDYQHASKLFVANGYALAPKHTFLFYVFFDGLAGAEEGMLVKQCTLPKLSFETKTMNQYNRPYIVQTKVHYDPVSFTLHDDCSDVIRKFLFNYYKYYFADPSPGGQYGYRGQFSQYLNKIRIYSLFNKKFSEYTLINPIIKNITHPEHHAGQGADVMQHSMTVEYESFLLSGGGSSSNTVNGFLDLHYDSNISPIGKGNAGNSPMPKTMGEYFPNTPYGPPRDIYGGSFNGNFREPNILDTVSDVLGIGAGVMGAISGIQTNNLMQTAYGAATAAAGIDNLMNGSKNTISAFASGPMNNSLLSDYNPNSPITIPNVGGLLNSTGGESLTYYNSGIGSSVYSSNGISPTTAIGGISKLASNMSVYSSRDGLQSSSAYDSASNMSASMPSDLASIGVTVESDNVRTVTTSAADLAVNAFV